MNRGGELLLIEMRVGPSIEQPVLAVRVCTQLVDEVTHGFEPDASRVDCGTDLREPCSDVVMLLYENPRVTLAHPAQSGNQVSFLGFEVGPEVGAAAWPQSALCVVVVRRESSEQFPEKYFYPLVVQQEAVGDDCWSCFHRVLNRRSEP